MPANKPIVDAIKAKKQDPSGAFVWTTYAALQSLQAGLNQSDDPAEIGISRCKKASRPEIPGSLHQ